ncbi:MAG TPA: TIGR04282 family arsenosugar biosynthesis glycosyltransferase [Burkholderiales bacterium]|nr:TIGR04282 family arsenosugar biosynthesis glycosyltransferase [Burkholderiales bacterium]
MRPTDRRVLVFAKAPRPGAVKTRLVPVLGAEGAAALQARLLKHTLKTAARAALGPLELHGDPADDDFLRYCARHFGAELVAQRGDDLGARMHRAFEQALTRASLVVLVGSDCPALTAKHLRLAAHALAEGHDAVFVPTEDGGYALIGLTRSDPRLFRDMPWSSPDVMAETRRRVRELAWRAVELETLWDVDRPADYERLATSGLLAVGARRTS